MDNNDKISEVIREAMQGWLDREHRLGSLDAVIAKGVADAEAGRMQDIEAVRAELRARKTGLGKTSA